MDCIDKILEFYEDANRTFLSSYMWSVKYISKLANKKVRNFNDAQFKDCLMLILNLFWVEKIDDYNNSGIISNNLNDSDKKFLAYILKSEINS